MTDERSGGTLDGTSSPDGFRRLEAAQADIRDAFFTHESGLFVLDCGPGAGKSVTADMVAAEDLARKTAEGVENPAETVILTSFSRDDAASILPGVEAALSGLVADPEAGVSLSESAASELATALRGSPRVGTIDSVLGRVFETIAEEIGFDGVPTVGEGADLAQVHGDALGRVRSVATHDEAFARLDDAYPEGRYDEGVNDLLATARGACRERRLEVDELQQRLEAVIDGTYPEGPPESVEDVLRDVERFFGSDERDAVDDRLSADPDGKPDAVADTDAGCHDEWRKAIDAFCDVLADYLDAYDEACRENGVVAHVDVSHWVGTFFRESRFASPFRRRLVERYTDRLSTVVVDEAQDVSRAQHDALAPLVDAETRVLLVGDRNQSIYAWRNAQPGLFGAAVENGEYFGVDWTHHESARATRTYRCRPGVAAAIDTVFETVFTDPTRGGESSESGKPTELTTSAYQPLAPVRERVAEPNLHIAAFEEHGQPGTGRWVDPSDGLGEAEALADCIATGLRDGRFESGDIENPGVTVLFHRRTHMASYIDAFADAGLSVRDTSRALFEHPLVGAVCAVVEWLQAPTTQSATLELVNDDNLPLNILVDRLMRSDWSIQAVAERGRLSEPELTFVEGLSALVSRRPTHLASAGGDVVTDVIETLALESDPFNQSSTATDNTAVLDRLVATVADWEGTDTYSLGQLAAALGHARRNARGGPSLPTANEADVTFRTIHGAKGDEDDVVAVADLGAALGRLGPYLDRFLGHGRHIGLAPPGNVEPDEQYPELEGTVLAGGPYNPGASPGDADAGLRWASERWVPGEDRLAGAPPLRAAVVDTRAERWRVLFVALSRARDHLVLPLPERRESPAPRDRWVDTLREAFAFDADRLATYTVDTPEAHDPLSVNVHRATGQEPVSDVDVGTPNDVEPAEQPDRLSHRGWTPRFVNPSTVYALSTAPEEHVLAHLSGEALHADHDGVADSVPLAFETLGPDAVGHVAHDVFAVALDNAVDTATLREVRAPLPAAIDRAMARHARHTSPGERTQLQRYVAETLLPQFAETELWERLDGVNRYVEEPLDAVTRAGGSSGVDVEIGGHADVVSVGADGVWRVDDLKVVLNPLDETLWNRYELQAAAYAWMLARQPGVDEVEAAVTTVGVESETRAVETGAAELRAAFDRLNSLHWNGDRSG